MAKALLTLETVAATRNFCAEEKLAVLNQGHLRRQVVPLEHFHTIAAITEADVVRSSVITGPKQPKGVQTSAHKGFQSGDFTLRP